LLIDTVVMVGEVEIPAHMNVLAAHSQYILGVVKWRHGRDGSKYELRLMKEMDVGAADAVDGYAAAAKAVVDALYSGEVEVTMRTAAPIIKIANFLQIEVVWDKACAFLSSKLDVPTICVALQFSLDLYHCGDACVDLYHKCMGFMLQHFVEVVKLDAFLTMSSEAFALVLECHDLCMEEPAVVDALVAWFEHDREARHEALPLLAPLVRWGLLPLERWVRLYQ
jgi:hypothetical protein